MFISRSSVLNLETMPQVKMSAWCCGAEIGAPGSAHGVSVHWMVRRCLYEILVQRYDRDQHWPPGVPRGLWGSTLGPQLTVPSQKCHPWCQCVYEILVPKSIWLNMTGAPQGPPGPHKALRLHTGPQFKVLSQKCYPWCQCPYDILNLRYD